MTRVLLAAPVRDRAWVLPAYLERVAGLRVPPGVQMDCFFLVNGPDADGCRPILERFRDAVAGRMAVAVEHWPNDPPVPPGRETGHRARLFVYLAELRNALVDVALGGGYDHLLSVDCDLMLPADALERLLAHQKDVVAATVCNDEFWNVPRPWRFHNLLRRAAYPAPDGGPGFEHIHGLPDAGLVEVDVTGACFLIHRRVLEAGCRFADHTMGEDVPFCVAAGERGFRLFGDAGLRLHHVMAQHAWIRADILHGARPPLPDAVQIQCADRPRLELLLGPEATRAALGRLWGRLFLQELQRSGSPLLETCSEIESFEWDTARESVRLRLSAPAALPPVPLAGSAPRPRRRKPLKGVVASGGRG